MDCRTPATPTLVQSTSKHRIYANLTGRLGNGWEGGGSDPRTPLDAAAPDTDAQHSLSRDLLAVAAKCIGLKQEQ